MSIALQFLLTFFFFLGTTRPLLSAYELHNNVPEKPYRNYDIPITIVDQHGQGNFTTIQQAIDAVPSNNQLWVLIHVRAAIYNEKVTIPKDKQFIFIQGENRETTIVTYEDADHVSDSATFTVLAENFLATDLSFVNTYSRVVENGSHEITWSPAILINGDKMSFHRCKFVSLQNTISDIQGRHYFHSCYIEGAIDIIWGNGQSFFKLCQLNVTASKLSQGTASYITAQGRESPSQESGFVFHSCIVSGTGPAYLGRAFRNFSRVVYFNTHMDDVVIPQGWDSGNQGGHEDLITYTEKFCEGPGADQSRRVSWEKDLGQDLNLLISQEMFIDRDFWLESRP